MANSHVGQPSMLVGRPPILVDGPPAPLVVSFVVSSAFSKLLGATRVQHATFTGDASLSSGITLTTDVVETTLKDSIGEVKEGFGLGEEVNRKEMK
jgi:hypothetical protein